MPRSTAAHINRLPPPAVEVTVGLCVHLEPGQVSLIHVEALSLVYAEIQSRGEEEYMFDICHVGHTSQDEGRDHNEDIYGRNTCLFHLIDFPNKQISFSFQQFQLCVRLVQNLSKSFSVQPKLILHYRVGRVLFGANHPIYIICIFVFMIWKNRMCKGNVEIPWRTYNREPHSQR